jgi:hypothetical protein
MGGFDWARVLTFGVFWIVLVVSAILALAGGDLVYLAVAYGIFIGMNLASSVDVIQAMLSQKSPGADFVLVVASVVLAIGMAGLVLTLIAKRKSE